MVAAALSGAPQQSYFRKIPLFRAQGIKDVADVNLDWTALDSSWFFVALDRMAWAWSSARRHRPRAQELCFICPNRDRAPDQRGADAVALARQLVRPFDGTIAAAAIERPGIVSHIEGNRFKAPVVSDVR
jgi:hypothetical protein